MLRNVIDHAVENKAVVIRQSADIIPITKIIPHLAVIDHGKPIVRGVWVKWQKMEKSDSVADPFVEESNK